MMDGRIEIEEKIENVDSFCQQLVNSGYKWGQIREIVISSLRSAVKIEKQIESGENRYRTGEESLISRLRKKLLDSTEWYKKLGNREREEEEKIEKETEHFKNRAWKNWREKKKRRKKWNNTSSEEEKIKEKIEEGKDTEIKGVLFVPHTMKSELAKRIRKKLGELENISCLSL